MSLDWDDNDEEEEGKDQKKGEDLKGSEKKVPQTNPRFFAATTLTLQSLAKSSIQQFSKRSSVTSEKGEHRCETLITLLGHKNQKTLEDIDEIN